MLELLNYLRIIFKCNAILAMNNLTSQQVNKL